MSNSCPLISVVILNYNGKDFLDTCLKSVLDSDYDNFEVILVDNASLDSSLQSAENNFGNDKRLKIIKNKDNLLFSDGNNTGIKMAQGDIIVILNNDTEVDKKWLKEIALAMQDQNIGAAQPKILTYGVSPVKIEYMGGSLDRLGYAYGIGHGQVDKNQFDNLKDIFYAAGTAMILRKKTLEEVGLFDEKFGMHWEDVDLSWRIRLSGKRITLIPKSIVYHKGSKTMSKFAKKESVAWYRGFNKKLRIIKPYKIPAPAYLNLFYFIH